MERQGLRAHQGRLEQTAGPELTGAWDAKATTAGPEWKVPPVLPELREPQARLEQRARKAKRVTKAVQGGHSPFAYR